MFKTLLSLLAFCALFSCFNNSQDRNLQKAIKKDSLASVSSIVFDEPQVIDSSHIIIYPLILEKTSYGGFSSGGGARTSYWNLLFYNTETGQQQLLTSD